MRRLGLVMFWASAFVAVVPFSTFGADAGSCESKAKSIKIGGSVDVKLVNEWDADSKEYWDSGAYYLKTTLARGSSYTVWIEGGDFAELTLNAYAREATDSEYDKEIYGPSADFGQAEEYDKASAAFLDKGDWESDDPSTWEYYIYISGDIGQTVTVHLESGIKSFRPDGVEDNPLKLTVKDDPATVSKSFTDEGGYYLKASLKKDRKYLFRTLNGTDAQPIQMMVDYAKEVEHDISDDPRYAADTNNVALVIVPVEDDTFTFYVDGPGTSFKMSYQSLPARAIGKHPNITKVVDGEAVQFVPGRLCADANYYDDIIDEWLFSIDAEKGDRWVISATGATNTISMAVYDSKGNVLVSNDDSGSGNYDVRTAFEATAKGTYYVGVCDPELDYVDAVVGAEVTMTAEKISSEEGLPDDFDAADDTTGGASPLSPLPEGAGSISSHGPHMLSKTDWYDTFVIAGRKGVTYGVSAEWATADFGYLSLVAKVFKIVSKQEKAVAMVDDISVFVPGGESVAFTADDNANYYVRVSVAEGKGLDYPAFNLLTTASSEQEGLYRLTVNTKGTSAKWSIGSEKVTYASGTSVIVSGAKTVKFTKVDGFSTPTNMTAAVVGDGNDVVLTGIYSDVSDHKDDVATGAVTIKPSDKVGKAKRTLWVDDVADHFVFSAVSGVCYNFKLADLVGDAEMTIFRKGVEGEILAGPATSIAAFAAEKGDYIVRVGHPADAVQPDAQYVLQYDSAKIGVISFAKTSVSAKKTDGSVKLTVKRSESQGTVRVRYGTVFGEAKPGIDYVAQQGELVWKNGDNKDKTITIKLIPELVATNAVSRKFAVRLESLENDDVAEGEYRAQLGAKEATVTVTEAAAKPAAAVTAAKVSKPDTSKLEIGNYQGVVSDDGMGAESGFAALASITFSATTKTTKGLSAKVSVGGKNYSFTADTWDAAESDDEFAVAVFQDKSKNVLRVTVKRGESTSSGAWESDSAIAELTMTSLGERIYTGELFRNNANVQEYQNAVTNVAGYYTIALLPAGVTPDDGIPAGNGYLTMTVNTKDKGTAKVTGLLADGSTKLSYSSQIAIRDGGESVYVPVFVAKSPYCFGGTLKLVRGENGHYVVDTSAALQWNNDKAALTADGETGWRIMIDPVGGYYNTTESLQAHYLTRAFAVSTVGAEAFRTEALAKGYEYVTEVLPADAAVSVSGNSISTVKRSLVKDGKTYDLENSVNPCNLQIKFARATGLVSGTLSLWSMNASGAQKEISGLKHAGVLLYERGDDSSLDAAVMSAGFFTQTVKLTDGKKTRSYTASYPFNLLATEEGEPDWYAEDWGEPAEDK